MALMNMALTTTSQMPKDNKSAAKKAAKKASPDAPPVRQPHAGQPEKRAAVTDKKSAVKKPTAKKLAPAATKPADVPKTKQTAATGKKVVNSSLSGASVKANTPPVKPPRSPRASSTTKISRGVSDVNKDVADTGPSAEMLESPEKAIGYYNDLLRTVNDLFKPVQIPAKDIDQETGDIHEDSVTQEMNRLISTARGIVLSAIRQYVIDGLEIVADEPNRQKLIDRQKLANLTDLSAIACVVDQVAYDLTSGRLHSVKFSPALLHVMDRNAGTVYLPFVGDESQTLLAGIKMLLTAGVATESNYVVLARIVEGLKAYAPALSVWIEFRLKRVLAKNHTREEAAIALIDTLLSTNNVRICATTSGKCDANGERISYIAMWRESADPGVVHCARLSSNTISTYALTDETNVGRFSAAERVLLHSMLANLVGLDRGKNPVGGL